MIAVFAPGQGSQAPGMLAPWLELPGVPDTVAALSEAAGLDLRHLGTEADAEQIKDTAITQPLIVALGVVVAEQLGLLGRPSTTARAPTTSSPGTAWAS